MRNTANVKKKKEREKLILNVKDVTRKNTVTFKASSFKWTENQILINHDSDSKSHSYAFITDLKFLQ